MFYTSIGYMFVSITAIFALGLVPTFDSRFYPTAPNFGRRLMAPTLFALLAACCFLGWGAQTLALTVVLGLPCVMLTRRQELKAQAIAESGRAGG